MPREIRSEDEFMAILDKSSECRVVRRESSVKLKLRTEKLLYVFKTSNENAEKLLSNIKINVVEL